MATMLSVKAWLLCSESLIDAALSFRASIVCGTPILFPYRNRPLCFGHRDDESEKCEMRDLNVRFRIRFGNIFFISFCNFMFAFVVQMLNNAGREQRQLQKRIVCHWTGPLIHGLPTSCGTGSCSPVPFPFFFSLVF